MCDRFWSKVDKSDGCWIWKAAALKPPSIGYGVFWYQKRLQGAHRVSWQLSNGPIPRGMFVLHKCDNPVCVNPDHLFLGTQADNMADRKTKGRFGGLQVPQAKLNEQSVRIIRASNEVGPVLAKRFGVTRGVINRIKRHEAWAHVR